MLTHLVLPVGCLKSSSTDVVMVDLVVWHFSLIVLTIVVLLCLLHLLSSYSTIMNWKEKRKDIM